MAETPFERSMGGLLRAPATARLRAIALSWPIVLTLVVVIGAYLRFHDLRWDQPEGAQAPLQMHPDERFLSFISERIEWPSGPGEYFDTGKSTLNPYNAADTPSFVYGTFPLFLAKAVSHWAGDDPEGAGKGYDHTVIWGRRLTAGFDTATIVLAFFLGAVLFDRRIGLAAALLYALSVLPTQLSHFWTVDPYVVFFGTATLVLAALSVSPPRRLPGGALFALMGVTVGLGLASKVTAWPILLAPPLATAVRIGVRDFKGLALTWRPRRTSPLPAHPPGRRAGFWTTDVSWLCLSFAVAMIVFRIAQPYAFTGPKFWDMGISRYWWDDIQRERNFQDGNVDYPPFVAFAGNTPFVEPLKNMVLFGLGPALGVAAWVGMAAAAAVMFRRRDLTFLLPLGVAMGVFAFQGVRFVAYMRYFALMYPVLCLLAAWGLVSFWRAAPRLYVRSFAARPWQRDFRTPRIGARGVRRLAAAAIIAVFCATAWWAIAFQQVYRAEHPRIAASAWIYANVPPGSAITNEIWDDALPYYLPGQPANSYRGVDLEPYITDSELKVRELVYGHSGGRPSTGLNGADYVIISSNRVRHSIPKLEREYPATIRYYELLDSGELGFELVATFTLRPAFLGITVNDGNADESFTVYDHPEVRIYKKTAAWDPARALALLNQAHPERASNLLPRQGRTNGLQFTAAEAAVQQSGGTFSDVFSRDTPMRHLPWLWWLAWIELAGLAAFPAVAWLFRAMPDRGYGLAKICGLSVVTLGSWLLVAWGVADFSRGLAWSAFGATLAAGAALAWLRRDALRADFRDHWRSWLALEAIFFVAFAAFLALRYANPDLWHHPQGGEKPVELAYLTAVTRSTHMPPFDPWFAGGTMNYYYMGWFFLAVPLRAFRLLPEIGFNLGVPTFAALAASGAASTVYNLVGLVPRPSGPGHGLARPSRRTMLIVALLGAIFLVGIGNLDGAHQTIERFQHLNLAAQDPAGNPVYHWRLFSDTPFLGGAVGFASGVNQWVHGAALPPFDWWRSSRVHIGTIDITEFPYWSFLFADLHPHLMGLPFFGLTVALALAYIVSAARGMRGHTWAFAPVVGLALGLERTVHTWDFPTTGLIAATAVVAGQALSPRAPQQRWWDGVAHVAIAAAVLLVAFSPYTRHFEVFNSGLRRAPATTQANQYFAQFGLFVVFACAFMAVRYHEELAARGRQPGRNPFFAVTAGAWELGALAAFVGGLTAFTWRFDVTVIALSALAVAFLANLAWADYRAHPPNLPRLLATLMYLLAFAIAGGIDLVTVKNDIERMNTVFKFSLQAWQLFALASAFGGWYVTAYLWRSDDWRGMPFRARRAAAAAWTATAIVFIFAAAIFLVSGTAARQSARFADTPLTLNGFAYMDYGVYGEDNGTPDRSDDVALVLKDDEPLIWWLRDHVEGSPVIVEGVGGLYHWAGRISVTTGLPAVIGWDWHEVAYRTDYAGLITQRRVETTRFYSDADTAAAGQYLLKYNVSYVIAGATERALGTPAGLAKFATMPALTEVFRSGENVIYRVEASRLPPPR